MSQLNRISNWFTNMSAIAIVPIVLFGMLAVTSGCDMGTYNQRMTEPTAPQPLEIVTQYRTAPVAHS